MTQIIKLTETQLRNLIRKNVKKFITETSRRQKAQQAISGTNRRIQTMAIISAENPMGMVADEEYNKQSTEELIRQLTVGHYKYFVTKGKYGTPEKSVMVYNITLEDTLYLAYRYNQESVIFIDMQNGNEVSYQYWEGDDHNSPLKLQHEENKIIDATNDDDFYTQISRHFKFRIPFFEQINRIKEELQLKENKFDVDRLIIESLDNKRTGKSRYIKRGQLYGKKII